MRMTRAGWLTMAWALTAWPLSGCVSLPASVFPPVPEAELLAGRDLPTDDDAPLPPADILRISPGMEAFIRRQRMETGWFGDPLRELLRGMQREGLLRLDYESLETLTAAQAFEYRRGNCLSYTNLIVALAREVGLEAEFQLVAAPEILEREADALLVYRHINAIVHIGHGKRYEVDFNAERNDDDYDRQIVSDAYARALYYSNLSAMALQQNQPARALRLLRAALDQHARVPGPWVNLGVLYSRAGDYRAAESAYRVALRLDRLNRSAVSNLSGLYRRLGANTALDELRQSVNPG